MPVGRLGDTRRMSQSRCQTQQYDPGGPDMRKPYILKYYKTLSVLGIVAFRCERLDPELTRYGYTSYANCLPSAPTFTHRPR